MSFSQYHNPTVENTWNAPLSKLLLNNAEPHESRKKQLIPVPEWLSARYLLRSLNDIVIEECYNEILKLFHTKQEIIYMLIKASTCDVLENILNILKNAQLDSIENNKNINNKLNLMTYLPPESIYNICCFLNRNDMTQFKMTSASTALIIFDIMKCYKIGSFNMHELIEINEYKYQPNVNIENNMKINRFPSFIKYKSLKHIYCSKYNIQFENMLILQPEDGCFLDHIRGQILEKNIDINIKNGVRFLIFDKRKICSLSKVKMIEDSQSQSNILPKLTQCKNLLIEFMSQRAFN
eukprot:166016_1